MKMPNDIVDNKQKFVKFSELFNGEITSETINVNQKKFIRNFITKKNDNYNQIVDIIKKFKNQPNVNR